MVQKQAAAGGLSGGPRGGGGLLLGCSSAAPGPYMGVWAEGSLTTYDCTLAAAKQAHAAQLYSRKETGVTLPLGLLRHWLLWL